MYSRHICIQLYYSFLFSRFYTNYKKVYLSFTKERNNIWLDIYYLSKQSSEYDEKC